MSTPQKEPLRPLTVPETQELHRVVKASSERVDSVRRAKALLALTNGESFTQAAAQAGYKEADSVCKLVRRFHPYLGSPSGTSVRYTLLSAA